MLLGRVAMSSCFTIRFLALGFALIAALLVVPGFALAKDKLPLKRGVFVQVGEPCVDPANFAILGYDGKSFSPGHDNCEILSVSKKGNIYLTKEECTAIQASKTGLFRNGMYKIQNSKQFEIQIDGDGSSMAYRWCAASVKLG
jgi:hypothetical protein